VCRPLLIAVTLANILASSACQTYRLRTYNEVRRELEKISQVDVLDMGGHFDDGFLLEDIFADLEVHGKGRLHLKGLASGSFRPGGTFSVERIGPWALAVNRSGAQRRPDTLGFGEQGEAKSLLSADIDSVPSLVARFDQAMSRISAWPVCPQLARGHDVVGPFTYCRKDPDSDPAVVLQRHHP
jgi:hypothetical protein